MKSHLLVGCAALLLCFSPCLSPAQTASPAASPSGIEVAPGLKLPETGRIVILETVAGAVSETVASAPTLVTLHSSDVKFNPHAAGNFGRSFVYAGSQSSVEVAGLTSAHQFSGDRPVIFVRIGDDDDTEQRRVTLLHLRRDKKNRVVADFTANLFGGSRKRYTDGVPVIKTVLPGTGWLKLTLAKPLPPGEYGICFLPADQVEFDDSIYDFTITGGPDSGTAPEQENPAAN